MTRRTFVGAGVGAAGAQVIGAGAYGSSGPRYFSLESYLLKNGSQAQHLASHLQRSHMGMANRLQTVAPPLVLEALVAAHIPQVLTIRAFASLEELAGVKRKLRADETALEALAHCKSGDEAPYQELIETVIETAEYCPPFPGRTPVPNQAMKPPRIFELRTYHAPTEMELRALHGRLAGPETRIFHRCGIHPVLYGFTLIGTHKPNLTYLTSFDDLAMREKAWAAFSADPEWVKLRAQSIAKHGQIYSVIRMSLFKVATYLPVR